MVLMEMSGKSHQMPTSILIVRNQCKGIQMNEHWSRLPCFKGDFILSSLETTKPHSGSSQSIFQLESKTANNFVFWGKAKGVYSQTLLES